jgi:hypothetical protein
MERGTMERIDRAAWKRRYLRQKDLSALLLALFLALAVVVVVSVVLF